MTIEIKIPPQPKGRPRMTRSGHTYTPQKTREYEDAVKQICNSQIKKPLSGAINVDISFYMPIPDSWSRAKRDAAVKGFIRPITKPDIDNLCKAILDGMNSICYCDDKQIVELSCHEYYGEPMTVVRLEEI